MMKTTSANRTTKMKVIENGTVVKTVANASINYGQDLQQLKKMIELAIRLSPQDPIYTVDKVCVEIGDGKYSEIDQNELVQIQNSLFKVDPSSATSLGTKVSLKVYVTRPAGSSTNRAVSRMRERENREIINNNENSKYDNIMRPSSPLSMKRSSTPGKARAQSRGRFSTTTPMRSSTAGASHLPRGMSPMRMPRDSTATNASTEDHNSVPPSATPKTSRKPFTSSSSSNAESEVMENLIDQDDMMPPPSASKSGRKPRRLTQMDIEEEEKRKVLQSINQTWAQVDEPEEVAAAAVADPASPVTKSFLTPFEYYSPLERKGPGGAVGVEDDDDDYQSCAGDLGDADLHQDHPPHPDTPMHDSSTCDASVHVEEEEAVEEEEEESMQASKVPFSSPEKSSTTSQQTATNTSSTATTTATTTTTTTTTPSKKVITSKLNTQPTSAVKKTPNKSRASTTTNNNTANTNTTTDNSKPLFAEGRTLAEMGVNFETSLRSYRTSSVRGAPSSAKKRTGGGGGGHGGNGNGNGHELSPVRKSSNRDPDGRPSIGTITTQWEFMRTAFVNNSDEELEWLMISKKAGAYSYAHRKHQVAEDKYFKSLYEIDFYQVQTKYFSTGIGSKLPVLLKELTSFYSLLMANPKDEIAAENTLTTHKKLKEFFEIQGGCTKILSVFPTKIEQQISALLIEDDKMRIVRKAREASSSMISEIAQLNQKYQTALKESEISLENMEKWAKREVETDEYPRIMREQEEEWMNKEYEDNMLALQTMRSYFPDNLLDITLQDFQQLVRQQGGLISLELANELKQNKLLHWLITHPDDIITSSFLTGDRKAYFENIENLDIIELRAISMILPIKFELDNDGRKAEWRTRFMNRVKQLVSQARGEKVKGAWDPIKQCRNMIDLPPLKPEQQRRAIYYYRTKEISDIKLKQFDDKLALLAKKEKLLNQIELEVKECKEEYDTVLKEMRDVDFIEQYGIDQLGHVKDLAKEEWQVAEKKRKTLANEVTRLKKSIEDAPITRDHFIEMEAELCQYLTERGIPWESKNTPAEQIVGVFDSEKVLQKRVQAAAKFVSAEQEALERKMELTALKSRPPLINNNSVSSTALDEMVPSSTSSEGNDMLSSTANTSIITTTTAGDVVVSDPLLCPTTSSSTLLLEDGVVAAIVADNNNNNANNVDNANANMSFTSPRMERKQSILLSANADMLNTLNKMFSTLASPGGSTKTPMMRARTPSRRLSVAVTGSSAMGGTTLFSPDKQQQSSQSSSTSDGPKEVKQSKSKLLKKLLGGSGQKEDVSLSSTAPAKPALSFLDQLKARTGSSSSSSSSSMDEDNTNNSTTGKPALSFLDQIKSRGLKKTQPENNNNSNGNSNGNGNGNDSDAVTVTVSSDLPKPPPAKSFLSSVPKLSFLDQIRARVRGEEVDCKPPSPTTRLTMTANNDNAMSFLEQIKARRRQE